MNLPSSQELLRESLETINSLRDEVAALRRQRDELLAACKAAVVHLCDARDTRSDADLLQVAEGLSKAIAAAEGTK